MCCSRMGPSAAPGRGSSPLLGDIKRPTLPLETSTTTARPRLRFLTTTSSGSGTRTAACTTPRGLVPSPPVASANPVGFGVAVTLTAMVSSSRGTPTGSVTFVDGTTTLGTAPLVAGSGSFTTSALSVGSHSITAAYSGDGDYTGSTSPALLL